MPVRKFRRIEDVPAPAPSPTALDGLRAACALSELTAGIGRTARAPRGVRRFRSVEEADEHRRDWEQRAPGRGPA